jgi:hypothetical protein
MTMQDPFDSLALADLEEASGELHRRIGAALRRIGEARAERDDGGGRTPRYRAAALAAAIELAAHTLGAVAAGAAAPDVRSDRHPAVIAAIMYATPAIPALLARLDQDRRLLASLARSLDARLSEAHVTPWGHETLRRLLSEIAVAEPARCAQALERRLAMLEAEAEAAARSNAARDA